MAKKFFFNMSTCIGCGACQVACKDSHDLEPGQFLRRVDFVPIGGKIHAYSGACNHCGHPACVAACPVGAMVKSDEGVVLHEDGLCIGCGACVAACPYGAVSFSKTRGVSQKCDSCIELRRRGLDPACVAACPTHSLRYEEADRRADVPFLPDPAITEPSLHVEVVSGADEVRNVHEEVNACTSTT